MVQMAKALIEAGVEVTIVTTSADGDGELDVPHGEETEWEGVPAIFFRRRLGEAFKYSWGLGHWLGRNVRGFDAVHVHAVFSHSSLAAARACRRNSVPCWVRPLGSLDPWSLGRKSFQKKVLWRLGVEKMLRGAVAVHYTTEAEKQLAQEALGLDNGVVIPLGVDPELLEGRPDPREVNRVLATVNGPYVLSLSRLHPKKELELTIQGFLAATQAPGMEEWRLVLAGEGEAEYADSLKNLARELDGEKRVLFPGWLSGDQKRAYLQSADLLVLVSRQENFGISVVEALACGVPVLVSPEVNLSGAVEKAGAGWLSDLNAESVASVLWEALGDREARISKGEAGRRLVQSEFSWEAVADRLIEGYRGRVAPLRGAWTSSGAREVDEPRSARCGRSPFGRVAFFGSDG